MFNETNLSNPKWIDMAKLSANASPYSSSHRYIKSLQAHSPQIVKENYATCGGGLATLDRIQYYPDQGSSRYRNNNDECRTNNQCASGYCNMTISGSPAQNIYNAWNQPNYQIGVCGDVDNKLPPDLRPVLPPSELDITINDITINDVKEVRESYRGVRDANFNHLFNDCISQTYWNAVPNSWPPLPLAPSCQKIVKKYNNAFKR